MTAGEDLSVELSRDEPGWLVTTQAARRLGVTPRTVYKLIDRGELPAYTIGRTIRLRCEDVDAFIAASRSSPGR